MTASRTSATAETPSRPRFPKTILVQVESRWHVVRTADEALQCLRQVFPDRHGQSHRRALDTCRDLIAGNTSPDGAQATSIVAAMEGGYRFEVHDEGACLEERLVTAATENGLLDMLLEVHRL